MKNVKAYNQARICRRQAARLSRSGGRPVVARSTIDVARGLLGTKIVWPWASIDAVSLLVRRPDSRRRAAGEREHHLVEPADERRGLVELAALGERGLIEEDVTPVREPRFVGFLGQPLHDRVRGVDLEHRP